MTVSFFASFVLKVDQLPDDIRNIVVIIDFPEDPAQLPWVIESAIRKNLNIQELSSEVVLMSFCRL